MKNFLIKNSKTIYFILGVLAFVALLSAVIYMSQYRYIRINYTTDALGALKFNNSSALNGTTQQALYRMFNKIGAGLYSQNNIVAEYQAAKGVTKEVATAFYNDNKAIFEMLNSLAVYTEKNNAGQITLSYNTAMQIYNYKIELDTFNDLIVTYGLCSIVCFAGLLVFANHSRNVYYISNLIAGIVFPLVIIVFSIVMIIQNTELMNTYTKDADLYNLVSAAQNSDNFLSTKKTAFQAGLDLANAFDCDTTTFNVYNCLFGFVAGYSLLVMVYSCFRYSSSSSKRRSILERVGNNND